jgi:hypothetical protein
MPRLHQGNRASKKDIGGKEVNKKEELAKIKKEVERRRKAVAEAKDNARNYDREKRQRDFAKEQARARNENER